MHELIFSDMKNTFIFFLFIVLSYCSVTAQKQQPPAFVMLEDVLVTTADPRFAPLFDTLTGNGKGSFISDLYDLVLSGQTVAVSDIDETILMTQQEVKNLLYHKQITQDEWGNGIDTIVLTDEERYSLNNILAFRLHYMTCYDKDMKLISRSFIGMIPMIRETDRDNEFKGWRRTIYFSAKTEEVKNILKKKCTLCADKNMSYLSFLSQIPVDELAHDAHYITFETANYFSENFPYKIPATPEFELPSDIAAKAKLIEKEFVLNIEDLLLTPAYENNFFKMENGPEKIRLNYNADISNIPMFFGNIIYGFVDIVHVVQSSVENGNDVFSAVSTDDYFSNQISLSEASKAFLRCDTISVFDPFTDEQLPDTVLCYYPEIAALKVLELSDGKNAFPIAICLEVLNYDDDGNPVGIRPILWIPINKQLITELDSNQAYLPGYPQQLTLWGYLLSGMYKGKIVSERPIDNAEWQKMREFLE